MSDNEQENRAFEAIIVSQLHRDRDPLDLDDLPELTESERAKMNALPSYLVETLWSTSDDQEDRCPTEAADIVEELEGELVGMNRADDEDMDEQTRKALDKAREDIIESMRKQRKELDGDNS